jgi:hypothetical protein
MAIHNRETLYPVNNNGNPCYPDGNEIRLWDMNREELIEFVNQCERKGVTFVATEKAAPLYSVLELDPARFWDNVST